MFLSGKGHSPLPETRPTTMIGSVFVRAQLDMKLPYQMAASRLTDLLYGDGLSTATDEAYEAGLCMMSMRVGPAGDVAALSKQVRVELLPPRMTPTELRVSLRWVATGITGRLFPALDADLTLSRTSPDVSTITIDARYQPLLGAVGAQFDRALLSRAADRTMEALLRRLASVLAANDLDEAGYGPVGELPIRLGEEGAW